MKVALNKLFSDQSISFKKLIKVYFFFFIYLLNIIVDQFNKLSRTQYNDVVGLGTYRLFFFCIVLSIKITRKIKFIFKHLLREK